MSHSEAIARLRDCDLLAVRDAHFGRLSALFRGERSDRAFVLCGIGANPKADPYQEPERWVDEALGSLAEQTEKAKDP